MHRNSLDGGMGRETGGIKEDIRRSLLELIILYLCWA